jgi:hypothetical protein
VVDQLEKLLQAFLVEDGGWSDGNKGYIRYVSLVGLNSLYSQTSANKNNLLFYTSTN